MRHRSWAVSLLVAAALPAAAGDPAPVAKLRPAPWTEGETLWLAGSRPMLPTPTPLPRPDPLSTTTFLSAPPTAISLALVVAGGKAGHLELRSYRVTASSYTGYIGSFGASSTIQLIDADAETLAPFEFTQRDGMAGEIRASFTPGRVEVVSQRSRTRTYELDAAAFDQSQIPFVLRRLPLADGFRATLPLFSGGMGGYPSKVTVVARETLDVAAGRFECYKVDVQGGSNPRTYWISADDHRYLVKQSDPTAVLELVRVGRWDEANTLTHTDDKWTVSATIPPGWVTQPMRSEVPWVLTGGVLSADGQAQCNFRFENFILMLKEPPREPPPGWRPEKPRTYAERDGNTRARLVPGYTVRPESWTEGAAADVAHVRYIADFPTRTGKGDIVEYVSYSTQPFRAVAACSVPKDGFEARKAELEVILNSLRLR